MYTYYACTIKGIPMGALKWLMTVSVADRGGCKKEN
jgi:hypothetical protein